MLRRKAIWPHVLKSGPGTEQFYNMDSPNEREREGKRLNQVIHSLHSYHCADLLCQELNEDQSPFSIWYQIPFGVTKLQESQIQKQTSHIEEKASI